MRCVAGHNDVALLQKNLESTQLDITSKSRDLELKQITSSDKALELGRIRWIVENLYERTKAKAKTRVLKASASARCRSRGRQERDARAGG